MSAAPALRTVAFGNPELSLWGAGWFGDGVEDSLITLGADEQAELLSGPRLSVAADEGEWRLDSETATLVIVPAADAVAGHAGDEQLVGGEQLCRASGRFVVDGTEHPVDCLGLRTWWNAIDLGRYESIRAVSSWFAEPDEGLALIAFRTRKARAHDADAMAAAVIGPDGAIAVEDPRLSTTYESGGWPVRAGLELWLASDEDGEQQYPRRASGEAVGPRAQALAGGLELRAEPFRWHSRGRDGAGMYVLARRS